MRKKLLILLLVTMTMLGITACGNAPMPTTPQTSTADNTQKSESDYISNQDEKPVIENNQEETPKENSDTEKTYVIGDTWTVDGQWSLTINSIEETEYRNEFSDKNPAQVFIVSFVYENIGYEDSNGIMDGLYFNLEMEQIIDSDGFMGYAYPGEITDYPQETPIGAKCKGQSCIAVDSESSEIKIIIFAYDGNGKEQKATFVLSVE